MAIFQTMLSIIGSILGLFSAWHTLNASKRDRESYSFCSQQIQDCLKIPKYASFNTAALGYWQRERSRIMARIMLRRIVPFFALTPGLTLIFLGAILSIGSAPNWFPQARWDIPLRTPCTIHIILGILVILVIDSLGVLLLRCLGRGRIVSPFWSLLLMAISWDLLLHGLTMEWIHVFQRQLATAPHFTITSIILNGTGAAGVMFSTFYVSLTDQGMTEADMLNLRSHSESPQLRMGHPLPELILPSDPDWNLTLMEIRRGKNI